MSGYGALPGEMINSQSRSNTRQHQDANVPYSQEIERRKWGIISGVKHVFTNTILGKSRTEDPKEERNSFLILSLAEMDIPTLNDQNTTPFNSTLKPIGDEDKYSLHDENSSALTESTENIGESNNY